MMATGGKYLMAEDGTMTLVEDPTAPHEAGDAPRLADGQMIGNDGLPIEPPPAPPTEAPPALPTPQEDGEH